MTPKDIAKQLRDDAKAERILAIAHETNAKLLDRAAQALVPDRRRKAKAKS